MKSLFLVCLLVITAGVFNSCSSSKVEEVKIKVASKVQVAVEKELNEAFEGVEIVGKDCAVEAKEIGENVYDEVAKFLKVKETQKSQKSAVSSLVPTLCGLVVEKVFPVLIVDNTDDYACLRSVGAVKLEKVGKDLCSAIDL